VRPLIVMTLALFLALPALAEVNTKAPFPAGFQPTEQVYIEGGTFTMGHEKGGEGCEPHQVTLKPFHMDVHEVTNSQWQAFCEATGRKLPIFWGLERFRCGEEWPDHPVVGVSHGQARAYAAWIGCRLPTEAEWEFAARGGLEGKIFDTGDELADDEANTKAAEIGHSVRVALYRPNGYGLFDMVGNVREWVWDFYSDTYFLESPADNPQGPEKTKWRVVKGGGWYSGKGCNSIHTRNAFIAAWSDFNIGFRCARDAEE
jgi:sulfatase modifying factor 1